MRHDACWDNCVARFEKIGDARKALPRKDALVRKRIGSRLSQHGADLEENFRRKVKDIETSGCQYHSNAVALMLGLVP